MHTYKLLFFAFLFVGLMHAQDKTIHDYKFVVVPEIFDFQSSKNEYQLNEMTKFYLEKQGFVVYDLMKISQQFRCEGLYADVIKQNTLIGTRLQLVLKDCNNNIVYQSQEGRSKRKNFQIAHQDALRNALQHLPKVNMEAFDFQNQVNATEEINPENLENAISGGDKYMKEGEVYLLKPIDSGFSLYKETESGKMVLMGKIISFGQNYTFLDQTGKTGKVSFDTEETFIIEFPDEKHHYKSIE